VVVVAAAAAAVVAAAAARPPSSAGVPAPGGAGHGVPTLAQEEEEPEPSATPDVTDSSTCGERNPSRAYALFLIVPLLVSTVGGLAAITSRHTMPVSTRLAAALRLGDDGVGPPALKSAAAGFPLLVVSLLKILTELDEEETGLDAILGAGVFNVLVVPALAALLRPGGLRLDWRPFVRDTVVYMGLLGALLVLWLWVTPDFASWWEGLVLLVLYVGILGLRIVAGTPVVVRAVKAAFPTTDHVPGGGHRAKRRAEDGEGDLEAAPPGPEAAVGPRPRPQPPPSAYPPPGHDARGSSLWCTSACIADAQASADGLIPAAWRPDAANDAAWHPCAPPPVAPAPSLTAAGVADADAAAAAAISAADDVDPTLASRRVDGGAPPPPRRTILGVPRPQGAASTAFFPFLFPWLVAYRWTVPSAAGRWWLLTLLMAIFWTLAATTGIITLVDLIRCALFLPGRVLDLTLLAAAASVTDVVEALGETGDDAAVAHILGVNIFDVGVGLGLSWLIGALVVGHPLPVSTDVLSEPSLPLLILFAANVVALVVLGWGRWRVGRVQVGVLLVLYVVFVVLVFVTVSV